MERSFFPDNERNDQERFHRSEKNERLERVLKNFVTISKRTERNGNRLKRTYKIVNAFLFSRTRSKLGTHFKSDFSVQIFSVCSEPKLKDRIA